VISDRPAPGRAPAGLTIGDLAARTGVSQATLRAWEARHGFPQPHRLPSGHRRYDEHDVALIRQVVQRKDAGVRLENAISLARDHTRRTPAASVFDELRRRQPQLMPRTLRKTTLVALTHAIEDECCARAREPVLFASFQQEKHYRQARPRWDELTRTARQAVVFIIPDGASDASDPAGGSLGDTSRTTVVHLPDTAPLRREWVVVCAAEDHQVALAAWERPGQQTADGERVFEAVWTLDPAAVRDATRACASLAEQLDPTLAGTFGDLDQEAAVRAEDLLDATNLFSRVVAYVDGRR
jgi:DICT domain-containing protein/predicted DNA-binding transcriptional regulator AlpA